MSESKYRNALEKKNLSSAWATRIETQKLNVNQKDIVKETSTVSHGH